MRRIISLGRRFIFLLFFAAVLAALPVTPAFAVFQCSGFSGPLRTLGYQKLSVSSTAVGFTIPSGTVRMAVINVETDAVRVRTDGTNPTSASGMPFAAGSSFAVCPGQIVAFRAIRVTTDASLSIEYYGD